MGLSRRVFLAGLAVALVGGPAPVGGAEPPRTRAWRWQGGARSAAAAGPIQAPFPFNAVGAWRSSPIVAWRLRVSPDGLAWGDWRPLTPDERHGRPGPAGRWYADLVEVPADSRYVQLDGGSAGDALGVDLIDSSPSAGAGRLAQGTPVAIIPRAEWGCDERLRFDAQGQEIWPPARQPSEKVVVHHTATANGQADTAASVRAIYYYHAVTQGWGDIGYNYLVDWKGNVFEGRYGGPGVEAGHAYGHNPGSIGIACIGTFSAQAPTVEMRRSLARLIAQVAPAIDPHDSSWFVDGEMPNLMGHRDAMQYRPADATECPGDALYALLPGLRGDVLYNLGAPPTAAVALLDVRYAASSYDPGATLTVTASIKNTGSATLTTQGPAPGFRYEEFDSFDGRGLPSRVGSWRLGLTTGQGDYPFRWGLPGALEPGRTTTVTGQVHLGAAGPRALSVGLVRESRYWYGRDLWPSAIVLGQAPTPTPAPTATATPRPMPPLTKRTVLPVAARNRGP